MKTDIERLHKNYFKGRNNLSRREGKTVLDCHELAGLINVTDSKYIIAKIKFFRDMLYIIPILLDVFMEHEIEIVVRDIQSLTTSSAIQIIFITEQEFNNRTRGIDNFCYVDFADY